MCTFIHGVWQCAAHWCWQSSKTWILFLQSLYNRVRRDAYIMMGFVSISPPHQITHDFRSTEFPVSWERVCASLDQAFVYVWQVHSSSFLDCVKGHPFHQQHGDIGAPLLFLTCIIGDVPSQNAGVTTAHYEFGVMVRPQQYLSLPLPFLQEWPDSTGIHLNLPEWDRNPPECNPLE